MNASLEQQRCTVVVGSGGVGKTTLAAALGLHLAGAGYDTLVLTFDPSLRLKDALGIGDEARGGEVPVNAGTRGRLAATLLDARRTFDRLVERYAPDEAARRRILENRFYRHLAGHLAGILEYMAVERLYEVAGEERYQRIVLDTPPTRQALDFLEAPERIVSFLDSGALDVALRSWFDASGKLRFTSHLWVLGKKLEAYLDGVVGLDLLREMVEFFQAFGPLYGGFKERALSVQALLRAPETGFVLVSRPGEETTAETMYFARRLRQAGYRLGPLVLNRIHPRFPADPAALSQAAQLFHWLGEKDHRGAEEFRSLLPGRPVLTVPLLARTPSDLSLLADLGRRLFAREPRELASG